MRGLIDAGVSTALAVVGVLALVGSTACESDAGAGAGDEASAVETKEQTERKASEKEGERGSSESKPGAAAEKSGGEREKSPKKATLGEPAPDFTLTSASGEKHSLSDYRGTIVVLEWTSTECPYVKRHYEEGTTREVLEALRGGETEVNWLAIDSSHFAEAKASKQWKDKYEVDYPFLLDPEGEVGRRYEAKTTPHMYVIDSEGILRYRGAIDDDQTGRKKSPTNYVRGAVEALQAGESVEPSTTEPYGCSVKYEG